MDSRPRLMSDEGPIAQRCSHGSQLFISQRRVLLCLRDGNAKATTFSRLHAKGVARFRLDRATLCARHNNFRPTEPMAIGIEGLNDCLRSGRKAQQRPEHCGVARELAAQFDHVTTRQ